MKRFDKETMATLKNEFERVQEAGVRFYPIVDL